MDDVVGDVTGVDVADVVAVCVDNVVDVGDIVWL